MAAPVDVGDGQDRLREPVVCNVRVSGGYIVPVTVHAAVARGPGLESVPVVVEGQPHYSRMRRGGLVPYQIGHGLEAFFSLVGKPLEAGHMRPIFKAFLTLYENGHARASLAMARERLPEYGQRRWEEMAKAGMHEHQILVEIDSERLHMGSSGLLVPSAAAAKLAISVISGRVQKALGAVGAKLRERIQVQWSTARHKEVPVEIIWTEGPRGGTKVDNVCKSHVIDMLLEARAELVRKGYSPVKSLTSECAL
jgi:hypothetical protein